MNEITWLQAHIEADFGLGSDLLHQLDGLNLARLHWWGTKMLCYFLFRMYNSLLCWLMKIQK